MIARVKHYILGRGLGPKMLKATVGSAGVRAAGMLFSFMVGVQLARGLGVKGYGIYGFAMSILALLTAPTEFGFPVLLTREIAAAQVRGDSALVRGLIQRCRNIILGTAGALALLGAGWLFLSAHRGISPTGATLVVGFALVPLVALVDLYSAALRGLQHIVKGQLPDVLLRSGIHSLLIFVFPTLFLVSFTPLIAMGLGVISAGISLFIAFKMLALALPDGANEIASVDAKTLWFGALPMFLSQGMRTLQGHLLIFTLGILSTITAVGLFRLATSIALAVSMPLSLLDVMGSPVIAKLFAAGDARRLQRLLAWEAVGMFAGCGTLALPFLVEGKVLIGKIFGPDFAASTPALHILIVGVLVNAYFGSNAVLLNMSGNAGRVTRASVFALAVLVVLAFVFVPKWDGKGAAIATSVSLTVWNLLMWKDAKRLLHLDTSVFSISGIKR